jgi:hypothetical protein
MVCSKIFAGTRSLLQTSFWLIIFLTAHVLFSHDRTDMKVLVLIIASDQFPVYIELQKIWRFYMHRDPEHIEAYFIKGNEHLPKKTMIKGDIIWSKTKEGWIPDSAGILNKTILSLEMMIPRMNEFDYILRTNLSSFYVFPRLLSFLKTLPKTGCYCGSAIHSGSTIASGCGFIISPDVVKKLVRHKRHLLNVAHIGDDVAIGCFLHDRGIRFLPQKRIDFFSLAEWNMKKDAIPQDIFQFRVKNNQHELRFTDDIFIHSDTNWLTKV